MLNLFSIVKYESLMLLRTWKFWILAIIGMFFPIFLTTFMTLLEFIGESGPEWMGLEGAGPFMLFNLYNTIQILIVIFLTSDFREKDRKCQVDQVMSCKSVTNFVYIFGKYLGIVIPLNILTLIVVSLLTSLNKLVNGYWAIDYYMLNFLVMNLPGLLFITAFIIFMSSLLRNTALVFVVVLIYTVGMWILSAQHAWELNQLWMFTDYVSYFLPMFPSDLVGVVNLDQIILQRVFYVLIGFFFMGMTVALFYPRLNQSVKWEWGAVIISFGFLAGAMNILYGAWNVEKARTNIAQRILEKGPVFSEDAVYTIKKYNLDYEFFEENVPVQARATVTFQKVKDLFTYKIPFVLNPGLRVESVRNSAGQNLDFTHEELDLLITLKNNVRLNEVKVLEVTYQGDIDDRVMFLNQGSNDKGELDKFSDDGGPFSTASIDNDLAYVSPEFSYLLKESFWYPTLYNPYNYTYPEKPPVSFFTGEWSFDLPANQTPVSQGFITDIDSVTSPGRKKYTYESDVPLKSLVFVSGVYNKFSANIAGIDMQLYASKKHNRITNFFADVSEDMKVVIGDVMRGINEITGLDYPYKSLTYVEVPLTIQYFQDNGLRNFVLSNSGVVILPEYMLAKSFTERFRRIKKRNNNRGIEKSDAEIKKQIFIDYIINNMFSDDWWNDDQVPPPITSFWSDRINVSGALYPVYEYYFDKFLQGIITERIRFFVTNEENDSWRRDIEDSFQDWTFRRVYGMPVDTMQYIVRNTSLKDLQPTAENNRFHGVMKYKGQKLQKLLKELMPGDNYKKALTSFIDQFAYRTSTIADLQMVFETIQGESLSWYFQDWMEGTAFPGFYIASMDAYKLKGGKNGVRYFVDLSVGNGEEDHGFVKVLLRSKTDFVEKNSEIAGNQEVRFGFIVDEVPDEIYVDPIFSQNHGSLRKKIQIPDRFDKKEPFDGIRKTNYQRSNLDIIVIDDMDNGFSLEPTGESKYWRPKEDEGGWYLQTSSDAYGKYKFTYRRSRDGNGMVPAIWSTELPASGLYQVETHIFKGSGWWRRYLERRSAREYLYTIKHGEGDEEVILNWRDVPHGWNSLGRFYFDSDKMASVSLSDFGKGFIIADAIRFIPIRLDETSEKQ